MGKFRISFWILFFSLLAGNIAPSFPNSLSETTQPETNYFVSSTEPTQEINAIPAASSKPHSVKSFKSSSLHHADLKLYKNSLPDLHNQLIRIDTEIPQSAGNKYLNFIYDFQTIK